MFLFFERNKRGERAVLVHPEGLNDQYQENPDEFQDLVRSSGVEIVGFVTVSQRSINPKYFVGTGKLEEIREQILATEADVLLFNHALSPSQERNIEAALRCRTIDRTGVILDIFAQRAQTYEGKLQVELAQLEHMSTRLVRGWTHLERQKGGIGLRGPGEKQLESDRRLLRARIRSLNVRLEKVKNRRSESRKARHKAEMPVVSLVGYTNAGKSTLFNLLTKSDGYVADQLFATLDLSLRKFVVPDFGSVILSDTVGFIRHLPHKLIKAFRSTLEEVASSCLLLHVINCSDECRIENIEQVADVLKEIDALDLPRLDVYNKIDLLPQPTLPYIDRDNDGKPCRVWVSSLTGEGIDMLNQAVSELLAEDFIVLELPIDHKSGKLRNMLYEMKVVKSERFDDEGRLFIKVRISEAILVRVLEKEGLDVANFILK